MMNTRGEWWCMLWHRSLVVVRNYGSSRRVRCTKCGREYGMHDGARVILPWYEVAHIYRDLDELAAKQ
jgi:hypothetical protein